MTDQTPPAGPPEGEGTQPEQQPAPEPAPAAAAPSMLAQMGTGEKLVVLAAALMLAIYIIFDLIADSYGIGSVAFVISLGILMAAFARHKRPGTTWSIPYETVIRLLGLALLALGVYFFISEVRGGIFDRRAGVVIGALLFYIAVAVSGVGAYQLGKKS